jgi:hypothetical protein
MLSLRILYLVAIIMGPNPSMAKEPLIYNESRDSAWLPATYVITGTFDVIQNPY